MKTGDFGKKANAVMPTPAMLQDYAREIMRRAVYKAIGPRRITVYVPEIAELTAEGEDEREAERSFSATLAAWLAYRLAGGQGLPVVGGVDLTSAHGRHVLDVEPGVETEERVSDQQVRGREAIPSDQEWFWTPEWQAGEREADAQIAAGEGEFFEDGDSLLGAMRRDHDRWHTSGR